MQVCSVGDCTGPALARGWCKKHYNRWHYAGSPELTTPETCAVCGNPVANRAGNSGPVPKYCSKTCSSRAGYISRKAAGTLYSKPRKKREAKPCKHCGESFETLSARFCSRRCADAARNASAAPCEREGCEEPIRAKGLCSKHWRRLARAEGREKSEWTDDRRAAWKMRETLKRATVEAVPIVPREVFERDGWMCGICSEPVDAGRRYPDPQSASLDHVVPLSRGGGHILSNVQCAHLFCNLSKGNRVPAAA